MICYMCEHKILSEHKHHDLKPYDEKITCEVLECSCTCHVKSTVIFN